MAKIEFKGIEQYGKKIQQLGIQGEKIIKHAVYKGAKVVADAVHDSIESLAETDRTWGTRANPLDGIRSYEKDAIKNGLGLSKMQIDNGYINTKLGFSGYYEHEGKRLPIPMVARSVESGTTFMQKQPFVRKAVNSAKGRAEQIMQETVNTEIEKIMK